MQTFTCRLGMNIWEMIENFELLYVAINMLTCVIDWKM
jgi:hypothetical protein